VCDPATLTVREHRPELGCCTKKMAEGSGCGLIDMLFVYFPGGTEEGTETFCKDVHMLQLKFYARSINA
jgi:hypothetical protein